MQISCRSPPIVNIFILFNYDKFPGTTSFFFGVRNSVQMWSSTIGCKLYKGKKEIHLKICQKPKALI
jgi:hypothetical protein